MDRDVKQALTSVLLTLGCLSGTAMAADLDGFYGQPPESEALPEPNLTFGSGWYLRGDMTATDDAKPAVLGTLDTSRAQRDWNYGFGGGVGYKVNSYFRLDLTGDYLGPQKTVRTFYDDDATFAVKANLRRFDALANGYIDLGNWYGFTPYVGAGVGFAGVRLDGSYEFNAPLSGGYLYDKVPGKTRYDFAWAAMAGVSYGITQNLLIDVGYRYLDLGTYEVPRYAVSPFNVGVKTDLTSHQIRAGLRYMIY
jgi:opacity protein-like surface antigen